MSTTDTPVRILHVDDDPKFANLAATFVEREGENVTVETETDASAVAEDLPVTDVDCIVSDYDMPRMDGIEFLKSVREEHDDLPFVLFTGKGSEAVASEAISAGVTDYLQKGNGTEQYELLCNRIENAVDRYRTEQRLRQTKQRFRRIFEQSHDGIMILDPFEETIQNANDRACELLGYDREGLLSLSPADIHPHEIDRFRDFVDTVYENETGWTEELSCITKDGSALPVHVSASTIEIADRRRMLALIREMDDESNTDEQLLRTLLDHATDEIYVIDPETGGFVDANMTACDRLGYTREELLELTVADIAAGTIGPWDDHLQMILKNEWISEGLTHRQKDGTTYPVAVQGKHVAVGDDRAYLIAIVRDLRANNGCEREPRRKRQQLEAVFDDPTSLVAVLDADGTVRRVNDTVFEFTDKSAEAIEGTPFSELDAWTRSSGLRSDLHERVSRAADGEYVRFEADVRRPDGESLIIDGTIRPVEIAGETAQLLFVGQDATERTKRERDLQRAADRLRIVLENVPSAVFLVDDERETVTVSETGKEFLGIDGGTGDHLGIDELFDGNKLPEETIDRIARMHDRTRETEENVTNDFTVPTEAGPREVHARTVPWYTDEGDLAGVCGVAVDITDRKNRERELQRERDRLEEFASLVSHDLRNPLRVAKGQAELAGETCDTKHLEETVAALDRMDRLIDDLLTLARNGERIGELEPVDLADVVERCRTSVVTDDATIQTELDGGIVADRSRLRQLIENLLRNAVEHAGEEVTITVGELDEGFFVEDDGTGIPEEEHEVVFEAGYSTSDGGTGFGLSIVRQVADSHGWDVSVGDGETGGARFEVTGVEEG